MHLTFAAVLGRVLQFGVPADPSNIDLSVGLGSGAFGSFATTLVVGAILVVLAPDWTRRRMEAVVDDALGSFVYGLVCLGLVVLVIVVLFITLIGIPFALLLGFGAALVWSVGAVIGYLAIADRLLGPQDGWLVPLLVAAAMNGALTLTGIGALISFGIGAAGFGTVLRNWLG